MTSVPNGWAIATLSDLLHRIEAGLNIKCEERPPVVGERGLVKISAVTWGRFDETQSKTMPGDIVPDERNRISAGDLLISRANTIELVGASVIVDRIERQLYLSDKVLRLLVHEPAKRWINYALKTPELRREIENASSGNQLSMRNISQDKLRGLRIPLAPEAEQRRVADKLDIVLARVDAVNDRLARVGPLLKRFRQSVLAAATSGKLTVEWRELHHISPVSKTTLQEICLRGRVITYGVVKLGAEVLHGIPCLRTSNVRWLRFDLDGMKRIDQVLSSEYGRTVLSGGEVLVNVRGTLGGVAVATPEMVGWNVSREVSVVPVDAALANPKFIAYWIASDECQRWLIGVAKGVAYTGINIEDLRRLPLNLPSLQEQAEIVRRIELLFSYAERLEIRLQAAQNAAERLTPALLAKAFRGELVSQDPKDEPASELLQRLRAAAKPSTAKRNKGRAE